MEGGVDALPKCSVIISVGRGRCLGEGARFKTHFSSVCQVLKEIQDARGEGGQQRRKHQDLHSKLQGPRGGVCRWPSVRG